MSKRDLVIPFIVLAVVAALGIAAALAAIFGDRWGLAAKKAQLLAVLTALSAAIGGCVGGQDSRGGVEHDASSGQDAGTDSDVDSDSDGDSDTDSDVDADAGSCSGVTCYESVPPVSEDVFLDGDGTTAAVSIDADGKQVLQGSYRTTYASRVSYRILDLRDRVIAAADVVPFALVAHGDEARFSVTLPEDLSGGAYFVQLYATTLANVVTYDTFPVSRYRLEVPRDAHGR